MTTQSHTPASTVHFEKIMQIALTVTDLPRAKDFYQNTLGMHFLFEMGPLAFFQCGDIRLMISAAESEKPNRATLIYFKVADIQGVYEALRERGVEFENAPHVIAKMPDHDLWLTYVKDPDGNLLGVMCERPRD
jgi:methylmalonyl-CoA/ethylmalonyl-CoA epimerase